MITWKLRYAPWTVFAIAMACLSGVAHAQATMLSPFKLGLWESTSTSTMQGFQIPPDVAARLKAMGRPVPGSTPRVTTTQACMTADQWNKGLENLNKSGSMDCTTSNMSRDAHKISFDESCTSQRGGVFTGHFEMLFDDDEHSHGSMQMKAAAPSTQGGQPILIDVKMDSHFVGADCGDVKPGAGKIIKSE